VEAFHEKLLEYWHISGPILKAPWRRVFTRGDKDKDEEEFSESLADLVAQLVKIPKDERDEVTAVLTRPSPTSQKGVKNF
jgi:hypothetical protein